MIDWAHIAENVTPFLVTLVVFGAPALYLWIVRETRFRTKQMELLHDQRISDLQRERDVFEARLTQVEPELEFLRQLVRSEGVRARIATLPHATDEARLAGGDEVEAEIVPVEPLHARAQTR